MTQGKQARVSGDEDKRQGEEWQNERKGTLVLVGKNRVAQSAPTQAHRHGVASEQGWGRRTEAAERWWPAAMPTTWPCTQTVAPHK